MKYLTQGWLKLIIFSLKLRGHQVLDYLRLLREIERVRRLLASKEDARGELESVLGTNLLVSQPNTERLVLGQDLLHGLQVGLLSVLSNLDLMDQAVTSIRNISGLGPLPAAPATITGSLILENGRVLLSHL